MRIPTPVGAPARNDKNTVHFAATLFLYEAPQSEAFRDFFSKIRPTPRESSHKIPQVAKP